MICAFGKHSVLHTFGLRAIWFTVLEHRTRTCGFGRRKKTNFASLFSLCSSRGKLLLKCRKQILHLFVLELPTTDCRTHDMSDLSMEIPKYCCTINSLQNQQTTG
jgi:hypothetical protein